MVIAAFAYFFLSRIGSFLRSDVGLTGDLRHNDREVVAAVVTRGNAPRRASGPWQSAALIFFSVLWCNWPVTPRHQFGNLNIKGRTKGKLWSAYTWTLFFICLRRSCSKYRPTEGKTKLSLQKVALSPLRRINISANEGCGGLNFSSKAKIVINDKIAK